MALALVILQLIPALIEAIKAVNDAIPGQGQGQAKLDMILGAIEAGGSAISPEILTKIIGLFVKIFNKTGTFTTGPKQ